MIVCETEHWRANQRVDSKLPGYLVVEPKAGGDSLPALSAEALAELGPLLARLEAALTKVLSPRRVYVCRWGHAPGFPVHFHLIPLTDGVVGAFAQDERYRVLESFYAEPEDDDPEPWDGPDYCLYIAREFGEAATPPEIDGPTVQEAVRALRERLSPPRPSRRSP
jgi:diadenosine tetraphosphate (Ap4A) HIT family hydrolase